MLLTRLRRLMVAVFTIGTVIVVAAPAATARPIICNAGSIRYTITASSKDILFTHNFEYATLAPGGFASKTIGVARTFTASVTASGSAAFSAGIILAKAETQVGFSLKAEGSRTSTTSFTTGVTNNTSANHRYVFFEGTKKGTGSWKSERCGSDGTVWLNHNSGQWGSWNAAIHGVLRCDQDGAIQNQFGTFSVEYKAVVTC